LKEKAVNLIEVGLSLSEHFYNLSRLCLQKIMLHQGKETLSNLEE